MYFLCLCFISQLSSQTRNPADIKSELKKIRQQADFDSTDTPHIDLLFDLSRSLTYINSDTLQLLSSEIKKLSLESDYNRGLVAAEIIQASSYAFAGKSKQAIAKSENAIALALKRNTFDLVAQGYSLKGMSWFKLNNYAKSYLNFQEALTYAKKVDDKTLMSVIYMNMATMFSLLDDYDEAISIYRKALEIEMNQEVSNTILRAQIMSNIAFLEVNIGDYENALKNVNKSIEAFSVERKPAWLAFCYTTKGKIFLEKKDFSKALEIFNQSRSIHDSIEDLKGLADVHLGFSRAYFGFKELNDAEENALKSLNLYQQINLQSGLLAVFQVLSEIKEQQNATIDALFYLKKAQALSEIILKNDKSSKVSLIRAKAMFDEKQNQLQQENLAKLKTQKQYIYFILTALLAALIFSFLIFKINNKVKKANKQLAAQSRVLEESKKSLQQINSTKDQLFSIIGHDFRGPIFNLKQLLQLATQKDLNPDELSSALTKLAGHTDSIQFTLDNLLLWGKTQMQGFKISPESICAKKITLQNITLFKEQIQKKNILVATSLQNDTTLWADKNHVDLIIRNLLGNAIKFSFENGEINIGCRIENNHLVIAIEDHGVGFQPEVLHQVLNKNEHHSSYGTLNEKGTGLGLLLCKEAVKLNKGKLWITSEPATKTTVFFRLPRFQNTKINPKEVQLSNSEYS